MLEAVALNEVGGIMSHDFNWNCWKITQCDNEECSARNKESKCWEIARKMGDYQATLNVCADCLVYLSQHENSILSPDEIKNIIETKRECVLRGKCNN